MMNAGGNEESGEGAAPSLAGADANSQRAAAVYPPEELTHRQEKQHRERCFAEEVTLCFGRSDGLGKTGWSGRCREYLSRVDVTWTCREARDINLTPECCGRMKSTFWLSRIVFLRLLAFVYFFSFLAAFNQNQGLIGSSGISPATDVVADLKDRFADLRGWERVKAFPSLFLLFSPTDFWLGAIPFLGMVVSVGVFITGAANAGFMLLLWLLHHSLFSVGQQWYFWEWESQLLETGFLATWLCPFWSCSRFPLSWPTPKVCVWGSRWLLFRIMLGAGLYRLRKEGVWQNLTAMNYAFETQPLPTPLSWYFHQHCPWVHVAEAVVCVLMSCVVPFLVLIPWRSFRLFGGTALITFQLLSAVAGNAAFANFLTIVPAVMCLDDYFLSCLFPVRTLKRMALITRGCAGKWSCPLTQGWPLDYSGKQEAEPVETDAESHHLLGDNASEENSTLYRDQLRRPRSCFCWYWPDVVNWLKRHRMPRGTVDAAVHHIQRRWWKILCEVAVAGAIMTCVLRLSQSATYAVWEVIGLFFLALFQAAFSAFVSRTKASYLFTEVVLSLAIVVSFYTLFASGPEVWSVWLVSCLIAVLSIFAYSTLQNAALVTKVHVEVVLLSLIIVLSIPVVQNLLTPEQLPNANFEPFQIVNSYGPVAAVQTERYELIIQGTDETNLSETTKWKNYEFECKPTNLRRHPCFSAPYHYHLDWLMSMISAEDKQVALDRHRWFPQFLHKLLQNNPAVTGLLRRNPFAGMEPPAHIRVLRAQYHFTSSEEYGLLSDGPWWELTKGKTQVYVEPQEVPGAHAHLLQLMNERERRKKEDEARAKAEEEARRRADEEKELKRRLEAAKKAAEDEQRRQEEAERNRREEEERRKREEEEKRRKEQEKAEKRKRKAQEEAEAEKRRREEEEAAAKKAAQEAETQAEAARKEEERKQEELAKKVEAEQRKEEEARKAEEERQRQEARKQNREELQRVAREAQRQQEDEKKRHGMEAEQARQRQEEERRREEEAKQQKEAELGAKRKAEEEAHSQQEARRALELMKHKLGGVPLRNAAWLSRKAHLRRSSLGLEGPSADY
ncbi:hypothetical protein Efla_007097 [Eimeria flavescens]